MEDLTKEEIENSYPFKLMNRAVKREFPFINHLEVDEADLKIYSTIFVKIYVDPIKLFEYTKMVPTDWLKQYMRQGEEYSSISLSLFVKPNDGDRDIILPTIETKISNIIKLISRSPAIPDELKLRPRKNIILQIPPSFGIGEYVYNPHT